MKTLSKQTLYAREAALLALLMALPASLLPENGSLGLGAASLGLGGAVAARQDGCESLAWNPAGLARLEGVETAWLAGAGGPADQTQNSLCLGLPVQNLGVLALSLEDVRQKDSASLRENTLGAAWAMPITRRVSLGVRQNFIKASPGGLAGWSMDLGLDLAVLPAASGIGELKLGLSAKDLVSALAWDNGAQESRPLGLSAGLGYKPFASTWLGAQADYSDRPDLGGASQWRVGGEQRVLGGRLALRAGYTGSQSDGSYLCLGTGGVFSLAGASFRLDWACLLPQGGSAGPLQAARQVAGLSVDFFQPRGTTNRVLGSKPPVRAGLRRNGQGGLEASAEFDLANLAPENISAWELRVVDPQGRQIRSFEGFGRPPKTLVWDGHDEGGQAYAAENGANYLLRVTDDSDAETTSFGELAAATGPAADELVKVTFKPALRKSGNLELVGADFDLSYLSKKKIKTWELKVVDVQGKTLGTMSGVGKPPKQLQWEGLVDIGAKPAFPGGHGYVLRTVDESGQEFARASALAAPSAALPAQAFASRPGGMHCVWDPNREMWRCRVSLAGAAPELGGEEIKNLAGQCLEMVLKENPAEIQIHGPARPDSDPAEQKTAQERADALLEALLDGSGPVPVPLKVFSNGAAPESGQAAEIWFMRYTSEEMAVKAAHPARRQLRLAAISAESIQAPVEGSIFESRLEAGPVSGQKPVVYPPLPVGGKDFKPLPLKEP